MVASGPSRLTQNIERLEGRRVIAVNSSCFDVPFADYVFSGDGRWLNLWRTELIRDWSQRVVTVSRAANWPGIKRLARLNPPAKGRGGAGVVGISADPRSLVCRRTSMQGAINLAVLHGATRVVLLGADGGPGPDGATHAHAPHPWGQKRGCWDDQLKDLVTAVKPLRKLGVEVLNASPESYWKIWPRTTLDEVLASEQLEGGTK